MSQSNGMRDLDHIHTPSWRIFRIMSEFVEGFSFLAEVQEEKSATFFGSSRLAQDDPYCQKAYDLARGLCQKGFTVVTGGGPGIMEAANHGAFDEHGISVGLNIQLPHEQETNPYVTQSLTFRYFFSRKVMLDYSADAYIFFPGGFGTLDEFFELITLVQTKKNDHEPPIVLVGSDFWTPLLQWMRQDMLETRKTISPEDMSIWLLSDDIPEIITYIESKQQHDAAKKKGGTYNSALK